MGCLKVREEIKQRRARLINQQDHIAFLECNGCPKRKAYDPTKNAEDASLIDNFEASVKSLSRLVIYAGGLSDI